MASYNSKFKPSRVHDNDPDTTAFRAGWPAWLGILGSVWLILAPFTLGYFNSTVALADELIVGTIAFILTMYLAYMANRSHDTNGRIVAGWLLVVCGLWLVVSPFVLNYSGVPQAFTNNIITGVLFVGVALYGLLFHSKRYDKAIAPDSADSR